MNKQHHAVELIPLAKVVFTNECSLGEMGSESFAARERTGDAFTMSSRRGRWSGGVERSTSGISILAKYRTTASFWKSALTRRKNGMLSCGRSSCGALVCQRALSFQKGTRLTRWLRGEYFRSHSCSHRSSALGRFAGFLLKHCLRKSCSKSEQPSGSGGMPSSTMRNITAAPT